MSPITIVITAAVSAVLTFVVIRLLDHLRRRDAEAEAREIVAQAEKEIETRRREAELELKERTLQQKAEIEKELSAIRQELHEKERSLDKRQDLLEQQAQELRKREQMVEHNQRKLAEQIAENRRRSEQLDRLIHEHQQKLQEVSRLPREEAERRLMSLLEEELKKETGERILRYEQQFKETAEAKAREILITTIQRYAAAHTADTTTSTIDIPNDEMKGRIIGREGRNIRAFEKATGVDVIIDDTPGVVVVSSFDTVRREVARLALKKLISDGRIHPSRIEEVVSRTQKELDDYLMKLGREAAQEVDVHGLQDRIIYLLGRLHFRTSYSQNVLRHSIEVAFLAGMMADELGMDAALARRCGLLHDIGKAADHEAEGGHPKIGADILRRAGEPPEVVHAALGHHDDVRIAHPYTVLVAAADACSASRPGSRRETLERYIKRMEELEKIAKEFSGVEQAYAIQAGREVRVMLRAQDTDDALAARLCRDIAKAYQQRLTYPGEIKVTVIREARFSEVAK